MELVALLVLTALVQYTYFIARTGFTRGKYGVSAPKTTGNETWERIYRVQQNTMEQLILFVPGMFAFAYFVSPTWALLPGALFIIGRGLFSHLYVTKPDSRAPGMVLSFFSNIALIVGAGVGIAMSMAG